MNKRKKEELDNSLKLLAKASFVLFIGIFLSKLFTYIYRIIIARHFGPEVYGLFSLALMTVGIIVIFAKLGLPEGNLRYVSFYRGKKQKNKIRYLFKYSLYLLALSSILFGIALFFLSDFISISIFHNPNLIIFLKIFSITIPLSVFLSLFVSVIKAYEKIAWFSFIYNILQNFVKLAVLIILIVLGFKTNSITLSYVLGVASATLVAFFVCKYILHLFGKCKLNKKTKSKIFKEMFSYSWPLLFFGLVYLLFYWTDSFMIGFLKTTKDVGIYTVAVNISSLLVIIYPLFTELFFPLITKEYSKNNLKLIKQLSQQIGKWIFALTLPILILIFLFPGAFINILFGNQYILAENAVRYLSIGVFFTAIFIVSENILYMIGKSRLIFLNIIIITILNVILNFILITRYGIDGAAIATMISLIFLNLLFLFQARHYTSIVPLRRETIRIFIVSLISAALLLIIKTQFKIINLFNLILLSVFFILSYFLLIFITSGFDRNDLMILTAIRKKLGFYKK